MMWYVQHSLAAFRMFLVSRSLFSATETNSSRAVAAVSLVYFCKREFRQWENEDFVDWPGLLAPVITSLVCMMWFR